MSGPAAHSRELLEQLPDHLRERVLPVSAGAVGVGAAGSGAVSAGAAGDTTTPAPPPYVLYWMRTGVRGHDNPALDTALEAGYLLGIPVFVFLQLSEAHPWSAARHHRFFIEGARDTQAELAERGVGFTFHLERTGHRGPHLRALAAGAALIITEDLPVTPLDRWTEAFAQVVEAPVWAVDTACTWPMRRVRADVTRRAFKFRKATERDRMERVRAGWPEWGREWRADATIQPFVPPLTFEPLDLSGAGPAEIDALIAQCQVDHGIAPVPHTEGGARAGYARWDAFKRRGIRGYHRTRNDPLRDGVSRMSAYLHFGHVSPFRVAREASEIGGEGAEKYLDELLIWRELAHSWCAHHPDRDSLGALPDWARETLAEHESDPRPALFSWETLARGRTGDALWDAAQRSLLIHGELHNNVRMTWGKALLNWTPDAADALRKLIDLNHRYALDGRDPSSYGGLLWCLGQFDRAFDPEQPVIGTVRPRPTSHHARRLDVGEYGERTGRPAQPLPPRVAVIGAGVAGLACARTLQDHGLEVQVFDKGRRPGGRLATRETRGVPERWFDHGTQYFTARDPRFRVYVESWAEDGLVEPWEGRVVEVDGDGVVREWGGREGSGGASHPRPHEPRWVATGSGLNTVAAHLAADVEVQCGVRIVGLVGGGGAGAGAGWILTGEDVGEFGPFEAVVITAPAPQAAELLAGVAAGAGPHELASAGQGAELLLEAARGAALAPCWALMVEFDGPLDVDFDGARFGPGVIGWMKRQGQPGSYPERWVIHAHGNWSSAHIEDDAAAVEQAMLAELGEYMARWGAELPAPVHTATHRWRYAHASEGPGANEEGQRIVADGSGLVLAGDWIIGPEGARIEVAWLSGVAAAGHVLAFAPNGPEERGGPPSRSGAGGGESAGGGGSEGRGDEGRGGEGRGENRHTPRGKGQKTDSRSDQLDLLG